MTTETRFAALLDATPEQLHEIDRVLTGEIETGKSGLRLYRISEASRLLGLSRCTVWRALKDGRLRAVEIREGSRRIPEAELRRFAGGRV